MGGRVGGGGSGRVGGTSHRDAVSLMGENSNDRRKSPIPGNSPFSFGRLSSFLSLSLLSPLSSVFCLPVSLPGIPFGFLRHDFQLQFRIDGSALDPRCLEAASSPPPRLSLSLSLSLSAVDFLVHRPNFPGRYGQFNTGLTSTSPCQIGGKPLFQWPSRDKGQNRFLRAPRSTSPGGRYSNRGEAVKRDLEQYSFSVGESEVRRGTNSPVVAT